MATPKITIAADDDMGIKPVPANVPDLGGIYHTRSLSRSGRPRGRRTASRASHERRSEHLDVEDEDDWLRDDGRKKQVFKGTALLWYYNLCRIWCQPNRRLLLTKRVKAGLPVHRRHLWRHRDEVRLIPHYQLSGHQPAKTNNAVLYMSSRVPSPISPLMMTFFRSFPLYSGL